MAARFWPDAPDARANLRTAVWALRQSLGTGRGDHHADGRSRWARPSAIIDDLERDGEPCPGLDDDWAATARAEHRRRRIARLDRLVVAATDDPDGRGRSRPAGAR